MKFKISEISKMSGFSPSGIRFFEKAGVISPQRGTNQKYREFTLDDLQLLLICKHYREYGYTLQESVDLLKHTDIQQLKTHLESQTGRIKQQIAEKQVLLENLNQKLIDIDNLIIGEPCYQIMQMPALLWVKLWQPGSKEGEYTPFSQIDEWRDLGPYSDSCLLLAEESVLHGEGELEANWGIAIEERYADQINFSSHIKVKHIPSSKSIRLVIQLTEDLAIPSDQLLNVRKFIADHHLEINGLSVSRFFLSTCVKGLLNRFDHLWIPVRDQS